jgi:hypothetical protein
MNAESSLPEMLQRGTVSTPQLGKEIHLREFFSADDKN